ncbi:MAG: hypothetical protein IKY33_02180 [Clostridia bacterium]|nr:hypothetical protein [Clostridia bacterium]
MLQEDILALNILYEEVIEVVENAMAAFGRGDGQILGNLILTYANEKNIGTELSFMKEADIIF